MKLVFTLQNVPSDLFERDCIFCGIFIREKFKITYLSAKLLILEKLKIVWKAVQVVLSNKQFHSPLKEERNP